jgi:hypothetical protein
MLYNVILTIFSERFHPLMMTNNIDTEALERINLYEETSFLVTLADPNGNLIDNITPVVCLRSISTYLSI